jgi:hypothetical protein
MWRRLKSTWAARRACCSVEPGYAAMVALAVDDDRIVTSDLRDIQDLVAAASIHAEVIPV